MLKYLTTWPNLFKFVINNYVAALCQNCRFYEPRGKGKGRGLNWNAVSHERHNILKIIFTSAHMKEKLSA